MFYRLLSVLLLAQAPVTSLAEEKSVLSGLFSLGAARGHCNSDVCYKSLPSDSAWTFLGQQGLLFTNGTLARTVESCHIHCLDKVLNSTAREGRLQLDLYALNSSEARLCARTCSERALGLSHEGSDSCESHNSCPLEGMLHTAVLRKPVLSTPTRPHLRQYGLMPFTIDGRYSGNFSGVVWQIGKQSIEHYVPQQLVYAYLHDTIGYGEWAGSFNTPTFQCTIRGVAYQLVSASAYTAFTKLPEVSDQCFEGEVFPDPPTIESSAILANISNGTKENPLVEVKLFLQAIPDDSGAAGSGLRVSAEDKVSPTPFQKPYCDQLNSSSQLVFESQNKSYVHFQGADIPWLLFWYCYKFVELQYYFLPKPPESSGKEPRSNSAQINPTTDKIAGFYPFNTILYNANTSDHLSYRVRSINKSACTVEAEVSLSYKIYNLSLLFLNEIKVNMTNVTGLPQVLIANKALVEMEGTVVAMTPETDGLLVNITQHAAAVNITKELVVKGQLLFGSDYKDHVYYLYFEVPKDSVPQPVTNITLLGYQIQTSSDRVLIRFSWPSPATPCFPAPAYQVVLSSPLSARHHLEDFSASGPPSLVNDTVLYQLNTTWYPDDYYNLTVTVRFGVLNKTESTTKQFVMAAPPTAPSGELSHGVVVAVAVCLFALLVCGCSAVLALACWYCWYRHKEEAINEMIWVGGEPDEVEFESFEPLQDLHLETVQGDHWELPPHEVIMDCKISDGNFGEVYKASMVSVTRHIKPGMSVAVKMLKYNSNESMKGDFLREIAIMKKISANRSPFIVNLIGCCTLQEPFCLILEYVAHGDLLTYLRTMRRRVQKVNDYCNVPAKVDVKEGQLGGVVSKEELDVPYWELGELRPSHLISFARQIASGMEYLGSMQVVHRDLACRNILVDRDKMLKIADFGLSREGEMYISKNNGQVPLRWMAVETIMDRVFTTKSDVWSYGVTLWEICTLGGYPYPTFNNRELFDTLVRGHRLGRPNNCTDEVYKIMQQCWNEDPGERPSFASLRAEMDHLLSSTHKDTYIHLLVDELQPYYNLVPALETTSLESIPSLDSNSVGDECLHLEPVDHTHSHAPTDHTPNHAPVDHTPNHAPTDKKGQHSEQERTLKASDKGQFLVSPAIAEQGLSGGAATARRD
nr:fibroblast growth factor receptor 1 [Halisarca dujardinii]